MSFNPNLVVSHEVNKAFQSNNFPRWFYYYNFTGEAMGEDFIPYGEAMAYRYSHNAVFEIIGANSKNIGFKKLEIDHSTRTTKLTSLELDNGSSVVVDYNALANKPQVNGVSLTGNKTASDLGINVPTKVSELDNDSDFASKSYVANEVNMNITPIGFILNNHINNLDNPHLVNKSQLSLGNVDNTSDMDKPVSTATRTAIDNAVLNVAKTNVANTFSAKQTMSEGAQAKSFQTTPYATGIMGTFSIDTDTTSTFIKITIIQEINLSITKAEVGMQITLQLIQDGLGGGTVDWSSDFRFPGGVNPITSTATNVKDIFTFICSEENKLDCVSAVFNLPA